MRNEKMFPQYANHLPPENLYEERYLKTIGHAEDGVLLGSSL